MPHQGRKPHVILSFHIHVLWDQIWAMFDPAQPSVWPHDQGAEGDVTNCCQTGACWNPLVKLMSLAYPYPPSTLLSNFCVQPTTTSLCMSSFQLQIRSEHAPFKCFIQHKPKVHYTAPHHCIHSINIWNHSKQSNPRRHRDHFTDTMYSHHLWILLAD